MKKLLSFPMLLGMILSVGSCSSSDDDVLDQGPVLTLAQSEVQVSAEGGSCTVAYKLENPVEGASLTVSPETQEWVSDFTVDEAASTIAFEVAANTANEQRGAKRQGLRLVSPPLRGALVHHRAGRCGARPL